MVQLWAYITVYEPLTLKSAIANNSEKGAKFSKTRLPIVQGSPLAIRTLRIKYEWRIEATRFAVSVCYRRSPAYPKVERLESCETG
jgi:hypothetical protein